MTEFTENAENVVLIGDVVRSREIPDRSAVQARLKQVLAELNKQFDLVVPLALTLGDEFQGLFTNRAERASVAIIAVTEALYPHRVAFGLGRGSLTADSGTSVVEMDGPCFHAARSAVETASRRSFWVHAKGFGSPANETLSVIFALMGAIRERWTERQNEIIRTVRLHDTQKAVAERLKVSPSVVSESLKAASWESIREGERVVEQLLRIGENAA